jgi:hypothetical protein
MSRKIAISLCTALSVFAFGTMTMGQASGANMTIKGAAEGFLAVFGNPPKETPVGLGLARDIAFGQNLQFQASTALKVGENLSFTTPKGLTSESCDSLLGGSLVSNKTGTTNPLSISLQFADFQCNKVSGTLTPAYASFQQYRQQWRVVVCAPKAKCKPDAVIPATEEALVKIENVAINIGPGALVLEGPVWGVWENGAEKTAPCIKLTEPPAEAVAKEPDQTLIVTQTGGAGFGELGEKFAKIKGKVCLTSTNNEWFSQGTEKTEPAIEIANA